MADRIDIQPGTVWHGGSNSGKRKRAVVVERQGQWVWIRYVADLDGERHRVPLGNFLARWVPVRRG